jgi:hypothetical protein
MPKEAINGHNVEDQSQFPITVDLRLNSNDKTKAKAFADVTILLGSHGRHQDSRFLVVFE